jgi:hypothetical protein
MVEKKARLFITVSIIILGLLAFFILFKFNPNPNVDIKLTEDKLITNQTLIDLIVKGRVSPLGNNLTEMVLDMSNKEGIGTNAYKIAYYTCSNNEHEGWIYYSQGSQHTPKLFGPYGWCLI